MSSAQFRGGPAAPCTFSGLNRLPTFVRVVQNRKTHAFDLLNDLDDTPTADEDVVAIYLLDETSRVFACGRGSEASGEWVTYVHMPILGVEDMRTEQAWCERLAAIVGVPVEVVLEQRVEERTGATS